MGAGHRHEDQNSQGHIGESSGHDDCDETRCGALQRQQNGEYKLSKPVVTKKVVVNNNCFLLRALHDEGDSAVRPIDSMIEEMAMQLDVDSDELYEVESIIGKRHEDGQLQYQVKWKGWQETTWEDAAA